MHFVSDQLPPIIFSRSESYSVVLPEDDMFLSGEVVQHLRDEVTALNTYSNESRIANAIAGFLYVKPYDPVA